jgi:hypothetical protein
MAAAGGRAAGGVALTPPTGSVWWERQLVRLVTGQGLAVRLPRRAPLQPVGDLAGGISRDANVP